MTRLHAPLGMRSCGDFDRMWRELEQTCNGTSALAHHTPSHLYAEIEPQIEWVEQEDAYWLVVDLPGIHQDDLSIDLEDRVLTIQGEWVAGAPAQPTARQGRPGRAFARQFLLEKPVEADNITTTYTDGVLAVRIPKEVGQATEQPAMQIA